MEKFLREWNGKERLVRENTGRNGDCKNFPFLRDEKSPPLDIFGKSGIILV